MADFLLSIWTYFATNILTQLNSTSLSDWFYCTARVHSLETSIL